MYLTLILASSNDLTFYPLDKSTQGGPLEYVCNPQQPIHLPGAHGEEIVRDLLTDVHVSPHHRIHSMTQHDVNNTQTQTTYTCGEDGFVRAWKMPSSGNMDVDDGTSEGKTKSKDKKEKRKDKKKDKRKGDEESKKGRFAPY